MFSFDRGGILCCLLPKQFPNLSLGGSSILCNCRNGRKGLADGGVSLEACRTWPSILRANWSLQYVKDKCVSSSIVKHRIIRLERESCTNLFSGEGILICYGNSFEHIQIHKRGLVTCPPVANPSGTPVGHPVTPPFWTGRTRTMNLTAHQTRRVLTFLTFLEC